MSVGARGDSTVSSGRYLALSERAVDMVAGRIDGVDESELVRALFGPVAGDQWKRLLATVLATESRLCPRDGRWFSADGAADQPVGPPASMPSGMAASVASRPEHPTQTITALALTTTGADPRRHRIARISVVRRTEGEALDQFDVVVRPDRRLSRFVLDAARLVEDDLDDAPPFAEIVAPLMEFVASDVVHAYGAARALAFLEAECRRADLPSPSLTLREIDDVVGAVLEPGRKPGLRAAARDLGVPLPSRASPLSEAHLAARIVERVRQRQAASPPRAAVDVQMMEPSPTDIAEVPFTRAWAASIPEGPGVYVFEDADGRTLYVGKAVALRRRLASYVHQQPSLHRQLEALGVRTAAVTAVETPSDLEATLLEARLIRERRPAFNVARQTRPPAVFIRAIPDAASPRVQRAHAVATDGARYFGPFESVHAAQQAMEVARAVYPAAFERRRGDVPRQREAVLDVCRLLSGQKTPARQTLQAAMRTAAASGDLAEVERLRAALRAVQTLDIRPSILVGLSDGWRLCVVEQVATGRRRGHLLRDGRLHASMELGTAFADDDDGAGSDTHDTVAAAREPSGSAGTSGGYVPPATCVCTERPGGWSDAAGSPGPLAEPDPDERAIVLRWLTQARGRITLHRLPSHAPPG